MVHKGVVGSFQEKERPDDYLDSRPSIFGEIEPKKC